MKNLYPAYNKSCLLLFVFIFITSCNRPFKTNIPQENTVKTEKIADDTPVKANQPTNQTYTDPLFFIDGQLCQHVRNIFQDKSGNLWFGTNVYGLMRYDGVALKYFSKDDGLGGGRITEIVADKKGNVWFGTYGGLTKYDGKSFTNFSVKDGLIDNEVWSIAIDSNGIFWIGTIEGVTRFDGEKFTSFPIPQAAVKDPTPILSRKRVSCIIEDKKGNIWFGTDGYGICKYDGKTFTHITKEDGLCDNNIYDLMEDSKGNIWIGTMYGGISRYDGKSFTNLYTKEGLNTNGILCIFEDREGRFWFGGWGGLFRYDGKSFFSVTKDGPWAK